MKFWDASAIVPLLVRETETAKARGWLVHDPHVVVWWGTEVECGSAIARAVRDGRVRSDAATTALARLEEASGRWHEVSPTAGIRQTALRLLRVHPVRAADALQLAAAIAAAESDPGSLDFACFDARLADAARKEGFPVLS